jgi:hypothetical protein
MIKRFQLEEPEPAKVAEAEIPKKSRGRPFQPGNPGCPRGAKNRTTRMAEQLVGDEAEQLTRKGIELAFGGNATCMKFFLDRILPRRNGRPVDFLLPPVTNAHDAVKATAAITTAVNNGDLTAEEAGQLVTVLEVHIKALEVRDVVARLEAVEARLNNKS